MYWQCEKNTPKTKLILLNRAEKKNMDDYLSFLIIESLNVMKLSESEINYFPLRNGKKLQQPNC